jgi:hypothetical protein
VPKAVFAYLSAKIAKTGQFACIWGKVMANCRDKEITSGGSSDK